MTVAETVDFTSERRNQIVRLLEVLNDGLPQPTRRDAGRQAGFVNEPRSRTCPDCLANGRVPTRGCETCGGSGTVAPARLDAIAAVDALPDDGLVVDPYMETGKVMAYGADGTRHDRVYARDAEIDRLRDQTSDPWQSAADELAEANRNPFPWERERAQLRRRYSIDPLLAALEVLRDRHPGPCAMLHSVFVYREPVEFSTLLEAALDAALRFVSDRMPDEIKAPGDEKHPAERRQTGRRAAA